jgi:hypothetical protein
MIVDWQQQQRLLAIVADNWKANIKKIRPKNRETTYRLGGPLFFGW